MCVCVCVRWINLSTHFGDLGIIVDQTFQCSICPNGHLSFVVKRLSMIYQTDNAIVYYDVKANNPFNDSWYNSIMNKQGKYL